MTTKILIIEDEHILSDMYEDSFSNKGWQVSTATSKDEGFEKTKTEKPDIVLLDILLFNGHGIEYLRNKKYEEVIAKIPVVVFSNFDDPKTRKEALRLGALEYLLKTDYTPQELLTRVKSYLQ